MVKVQRLFAKTNLKVPVCRTYRTITQKCLQLELPTENSVYSQENRNRAGNYAHLTSENGKLAAFASGRPAFQQHVKRAEGSDTTHASHTRKTMIAGCTNPDFDKSEKDHAAQRGRDASGQRRASCASLSRRLYAFFGSTLDRDPKGAKFAVLNPDHAGIPKRVERSEGSNSAPRPKRPPVSVCVSPCVRSFSESRVCTHFRL